MPQKSRIGLLAALLSGMFMAMQSTGCAEDSSVPRSQDISPVYVYSKKKVQFIGIDAQGRPALSVYRGKQVQTTGTVSDVRLPGRSPSVSIEDAVVYFSLAEGQSIPNAPGARAMELRFDEHAGAGPFTKGDAWLITFSDAGELVDLIPAPKAPNP